MNADLVGAGTAVYIFATSIAVFTAPGLNRPPLYYVRTGL